MTQLRLSEAIREGCKYGPQVFGGFGSYRGKTCALGAALSSVGYNFDEEPTDLFYSFPLLAPIRQMKCPACKKPFDEITNAISIAHLNDDHRWSREAIAEWVETVERKLGLWEEPKADSEVVREAVKASVEYANKV